MKKSLFIPLLLTPMLITACSSVKDENAIYNASNLEDTPIEITAMGLDNMIRDKFSFVVLMYTDSCGNCDKALRNVNDFIKETHQAIYKIQMYSASIEYLSAKQSTYYNTDMSYPLLYVFDNGTLTHNIESIDLINYTSLKRKLDNQTKTCNIYTTTSFDAYVDFTKDKDEYLVFFYTSLYPEESLFYSTRLFPLAQKSEKTTILLDFHIVNRQIIEYFYSLVNVPENSIIWFKDGKTKATAQIDESPIDYTLNLLNSFFNVNPVDSAS